MKVVWLKQSQTRFREIGMYISQQFGEQAASKFRTKVFDFLELLERFPELGSLEVEEKNIRGFQVSKEIRLFYRINKNHISLLTFFDSRQDPRKRPS